MVDIPLVSIIVPVYNVAKYLPQCLDSLKNQTLRQIEIICVNDASTDDSLSILRRYEQEDSRFVVVDLPQNMKQGGARNVGIRLAKSDYLAFVDSDDWVDTRMYEQLYKEALEKEADLVSSDYYIYRNESDIQICKNLESKTFALSIKERNRIFLLNGIRLWTSVFRRSLFFDNQLFFPEHLFYEDNAIVGALYLSSKKAVKLDIPLYYYRMNNISTTRCLNNYRYFDRLETSKMFLEHMKRLGFYAIYPQEVEFRFVELFYVNTVMIALSQFSPPAREYIERVQKEVRLFCPHYVRNIYFKKRVPLKIRLLLSFLLYNTRLGIVFYQICKRQKF